MHLEIYIRWHAHPRNWPKNGGRHATRCEKLLFNRSEPQDIRAVARAEPTELMASMLPGPPAPSRPGIILSHLPTVGSTRDSRDVLPLYADRVFATSHIVDQVITTPDNAGWHRPISERRSRATHNQLAAVLPSLFTAHAGQTAAVFAKLEPCPSLSAQMSRRRTNRSASKTLLSKRMLTSGQLFRATPAT